MNPTGKDVVEAIRGALNMRDDGELYNIISLTRTDAILLLNYVGALTIQAALAEPGWPSGQAPDCKSGEAGSTPAPGSTEETP